MALVTSLTSGSSAPASTSGSSGSGYGIVLGIVNAVLPILAKAVAGLFKDHSPEWRFDNGCDKMHQYIPDGDIKGWLQPQIDNARIGIKGLLTSGKAGYAGGAPLYYLPFLAFPISFKNKNGVIETYAGDTDLQKLAVAYYIHGDLPTSNAYYEGRPEYNITDGIALIKASSYYAQMTNSDASESDVHSAVMGSTTGLQTLVQKYWWVLVVVPVGSILVWVLRRVFK